MRVYDKIQLISASSIAGLATPPAAEATSEIFLSYDTKLLVEPPRRGLRERSRTSSPTSAASPVAPSASSFSGFGVLHSLHASFQLNTRSWQLGHSQSPGLRPNTLAPDCGLDAPHLRHSMFLENCRSEQAGQYQSPGNGRPPETTVLTSGGTVPEGFRVSHCRHLSFFAN